MGGDRGLRVVAAVLAALIISGTVAPVTAVGAQASKAPVSEINKGLLDRTTDASPRALQTTAAQVLDGSKSAERTAEFDQIRRSTTGAGDDSSTRQPTPRERPSIAVPEALTTTTDAYRGADRVRSARVFDRHISAVSQLAREAGQDRSRRIRIDRATRLITYADRAVARTALADARRAVSSDSRQTAATDQLAQAEQAFKRGEDLRLQATGQPLKSAIERRTAAISEYRRAWKYSQAAISTQVRAENPRITLSNRVDPLVLNDTGEFPYRITGNVTGVRPSNVGSVVVTVGGNRTTTAELNRSTDPLGNTSFVAELNRSARETTVEVSVRLSSSSARGGGSGSPLTDAEIQQDATAYVRDARRGAGLDVETLSSDGSVTVNFRTTLSDNQTALRRLSLSASRSTSFQTSFRTPTENLAHAPSLPGARPVAYVRLAEPVNNSALSTAQYILRVDDDALPADATRSDVVVYRLTDGEWSAVETAYRREERYAATTDGLSTIAVGVRADESTPPTPSRAKSPTPPGSPAPTATEQDVTTPSGDDGSRSESGGDGFWERLVRGVEEFFSRLLRGGGQVATAETDSSTILLAASAHDRSAPPMTGATSAETPAVDRPPRQLNGDGAEIASTEVRLDGDGVPEQYERSVLKTDPLSADSDIGVTSANESGDGVLDGREDPDSDGLPVQFELAFGTNPFVADTDGDGLNDRFEVRQDPPFAEFDRFDPLDRDTDNDGTIDGEEDHDGDDVTTLGELNQNTDIDIPDTDGDGFDDRQEFAGSTNATVPDTDSDGLEDGAEPRLGTDPADSDTDDDGVLDGNETFITTAENASTGVTVNVLGTGNVAESVSITPKPTYFDDTDAEAGPTVRLTSRAEFESATVRIPIDDAVPASEYDDLAIYTWNGSANDSWSPLATTVDNGTAVAETSNFSFFTVIDSDEWVSATTVPTSETGAEPVAIGEQPNYTCTGACAVRNKTTLLIGGEPSARKITVEQGDTSFQVVPLSNGQSIKRFYDYGDAEINSPLPIAKSDTSRLFFWSGPNGISLVVIHDKPRDGSGAAVDFGFDGLPFDSGSWVVQDDGNDFTRYGSRSRPAWSWTFDNTDGGAFRGGLTNQTITVTPYFNDEASRAPLTPGTLTGWEALTGQATAPESESLALDEPVTIRIPEAPAEDGSTDVEGDSGTASFDYELNESVSEVAVRYQTEQTNVDPEANLTLTGPNGTTISEPLNIGTVGTVEQTIDVSSLSAGTLNVSVSATGVDARAQLIPRETSVDSDGDGIPDRLEDREWTARNGPAKTFETSSDDPDTDGDGIPDGEEANFATEVVDGERRTTVTLASNPAETDTDDDGLTDGEEADLRTNPLLQDTEADGLLDAEDPQPTVPLELSEDEEGDQSFHLSDGEPVSEFLDGMVYGDWGYVNDRAGSRTAAYLFGWLFPYLWIAAGSVPVVEDGVELALEIRDCLAINDALWENALDCGFALWELATTGAKLIGAATSITGVGAALAGAVYAADEAADIGRAVTVAVKIIKKAPASALDDIGRMIGKQFGSTGGRLVRSVLDRVPGTTSLVRGMQRGQLENAGLSEDVAKQVAESVDDLDAAKRVIDRIDNLDQIPPRLQSELVTGLVRQGDAGLRLADELDAETLRVAYNADALGPAADVVANVDDGARILNQLEAEQARQLLRADEPAPFVRLVSRSGTGVADEATAIGRFDAVVRSTGQLYDEVGRVAAEQLLSKMSDEATAKFLAIQADGADQMRITFARYVEQGAIGKYSTEQVERLFSSRNLNKLSQSLYRLEDDVNNFDDLFGVGGGFGPTLAPPSPTANNIPRVQGAIGEAVYQANPNVIDEAVGESANIRRVGSVGEQYTITTGSVAARSTKLSSNAKSVVRNEESVVDLVPVAKEGDKTDVVVIHKTNQKDNAKQALSSVNLENSFDKVRTRKNTQVELDSVINADTFKRGNTVLGGVLELKTGGLSKSGAITKIASYKSLTGVTDLSRLDEPVVFAQNTDGASSNVVTTINKNGGQYVSIEVIDTTRRSSSIRVPPTLREIKGQQQVAEVEVGSVQHSRQVYPSATISPSPPMYTVPSATTGEVVRVTGRSDDHRIFAAAESTQKIRLYSSPATYRRSDKTTGGCCTSADRSSVQRRLPEAISTAES